MGMGLERSCVLQRTCTTFKEDHTLQRILEEYKYVNVDTIPVTMSQRKTWVSSPGILSISSETVSHWPDLRSPPMGLDLLEREPSCSPVSTSPSLCSQGCTTMPSICELQGLNSQPYACEVSTLMLDLSRQSITLYLKALLQDSVPQDTPLIPAMERQSHRYLCEFEASLDYRVNSSLTRATKRILVSKTNKQNPQTNKQTITTIKAHTSRGMA